MSTGKCIYLSNKILKKQGLDKEAWTKFKKIFSHYNLPGKELFLPYSYLPTRRTTVTVTAFQCTCVTLNSRSGLSHNSSLKRMHEETIWDTLSRTGLFLLDGNTMGHNVNSARKKNWQIMQQKLNPNYTLSYWKFPFHGLLSYFIF